jgi:hypothetical protein
MADIIKRLQHYEHKHSEKIAAFAIVSVIVYLIVAQ